MKKVLVLCVCFAAVLLLGTSDVRAAGFGIYGSIGGDGSATWSDDSSGINSSFKDKTAHQGAGFVLDTAVARDSFFNYQLNLGYDEFTNKIDGFSNEVELGGLMISNAFGFGIVRTDGFRLWMGPEIRLAWPNGSQSGWDYDFFGGGVGPVLGMNFNLPGTVSFMVKAGYLFMNYEGQAESATSSSWDLDIKERLIYVNIGILFRSPGDIF
ncbi:MAG: hypothetical protein A2X58_00575 [Nitrospirae bacterium GWC2_56_14]|nr:MAG: hypothetical protein A2X58_00575 [Nitrospirae bacterium GWC2_56_14]